MAILQKKLRSSFPVLVTLLVSALGGSVANLLGMPAGWLMGGALAVAIASMAGLPMVMPDRLRDVSFLLIGMSMGASVAPDSLALIASWPVTIAALALELMVIVAATGWVLARVFKLDTGTAYLSAFPGHLSFVLGIASSGVGNARQIVIIQVIRIMMLTICVPIGTLFLPIAHFAPVVRSDYLDIGQLLLLAAGCVAVGLVFVKLRMPAGFVLGAMAAATAAKLAGLYSAAMPVPLVTLTFVLTGALIGSRFAGISRRELLTAAKGGLVATGVTVAIVSVVAFLASLIVDMPYGQIWLGLAPGALEGMGALGIALGYDTAFVAAHHVLRLLMLTLAIPTVVMLIKRRESATMVGHNSD
ncbi:MAG: AbrB family transcriptional regulator [Devosia sp.]